MPNIPESDPWYDTSAPMYGQIYNLGSGTGEGYLKDWGGLPGSENLFESRGEGLDRFNYLNPFRLDEYLKSNNLNLVDKPIEGNRSVRYLEGPQGVLPSTVTNISWDDPLFGALINMGVGAVTGGAFGGGGIAGGMGVSNPTIAAGINQGAAGAIAAGGSDQSVTKGFGQGALAGAGGSYTSSLNPASYAGIENPTLQQIVNRGIGSGATTYAQTGDAGRALQSGLTSAGVAAGNTGGKAMGGIWDSLWNDDDSLYNQQGNMVTGGMEDIAPPQVYSDEGGRFGSFDIGGKTYQSPSEFRSAGSYGESAPTKQVSSFSMPEFGDVAGRVGNFALNNAGDLASMLYGFYNNRKQQKALQGQIGGLEGLFSQNSPYAQQLRKQLAAQASAKGKRLNTSGRETQLQAMLAERSAGLAPSLYQMQQGQNQLKNQQMNMLLQGANKLGAFNGLRDIFNRPSLTGPGSFSAYENMDNMYGNVG